MTTQVFLNNPQMNIQHVSATFTLAFENEEVFILIPDNGYDMSSIETIDLNDQYQIKVQQDCI